MKNGLISLLLMLLAMSAAAQHNGIYIENFEIEPGSTIVVPAIFYGSEASRGLQFNMTLPLGMTMQSYELDEEVADKYKMRSYERCNAGVWTIGIYPYGRICLPADTAIVVMRMTLEAAPDFAGGDIYFWKQRGAHMDSATIVFGDDTTTVAVPRPSVLEQGNKEDSLWPVRP
ncbi:MAG: hypothetical protein IKI10_04015 [Muribaculaceae bacterium]|nr:hypothetical protein [Muribaculaceae bacterium]